jgi:2-polyprenyl-6-methoxyphenol hydroxylase-like FAD-dependent oxidoreductase
VFSVASDRHIEIMRDDLSEIYYDVARDDVEYVFGDWITAISPDGDVTFERGAPRRFDLVVGADGLHSGVRRLVFSHEARHTHLAGAYVSVLSVWSTGRPDQPKQRRSRPRRWCTDPPLVNGVAS